MTGRVCHQQASGFACVISIALCCAVDSTSCVCGVRVLGLRRSSYGTQLRSRANNPPALSRALLELIKRDIKPRDIMTRAAFENAMVRMTCKPNPHHDAHLTASRRLCSRHHQLRGAEGVVPFRRKGCFGIMFMLCPTRCSEAFYGHPPRLCCRQLKPDLRQVVIMALGGSTNAVLHLIAMARAAGVEVTLDDFQACSPPPLRRRLRQR